METKKKPMSFPFPGVRTRLQPRSASEPYRTPDDARADLGIHQSVI